MRVRVTGTQQLAKVADVLTAQGNSKALKRRMAKSFKKVAEPITRDQRENLLTELPHRGGAAAEIGSESKTTIRTDWGRATVTISDSWPGHDIKAIDRGVLRHPLFAHTTTLGHPVGRRLGEWFTTKVTPYTLTQPFLDHKSTVRAELAKEMDALAEEIARET